MKNLIFWTIAVLGASVIGALIAKFIFIPFINKHPMSLGFIVCGLALLAAYLITKSEKNDRTNHQ